MNLDIGREARGEFSRKDFLVYDLENRDLSHFAGESIEKEHDALAGRSRERYDVLVLRDPFNLFASALQFYVNGTIYLRGLPRRSMLGKVERWKQYAREFIGQTHFLPQKKIAMTYNQWFLSAEYRKTIAFTLGIDAANSAVEHVPGFGGGSSFDGAKYQNAATRMRTLERWKHFRGSELYRSLFDDEVFDLSGKIFGDISGTGCLRPKKPGQPRPFISASKIYYEEARIFSVNRCIIAVKKLLRDLRNAYARSLKQRGL
jgi:hypothetical protein